MLWNLKEEYFYTIKVGNIPKMPWLLYHKNVRLCLMHPKGQYKLNNGGQSDKQLNYNIILFCVI